MSSLWSGMKSAPVGGRGNFLKAGYHFDIEIDRCLTLETREKGLAFIAEFKVLTSTCQDIQPGSSCSWYQSMGRNIRETALSAIKGFIAAASGLDPRKDAQRIKDELDPGIEEMMDAVTGQENVLCGTKIHVETYSKQTKEGGDFTVHIFTPFVEGT